MDGYRSDSYGDHLAASYDAFFSDLLPSEHQIDLLRECAGTGVALELGVGTGRVAIPLAKTGVSVIGVDTSNRMLDLLREKSAGLPVRAVLGDAADFSLDGEPDITVAYAVFNTFFMLAGRSGQACCLHRLSQLLTAHGAFVVELFVPRPERFHETDDIRIKKLTGDQVVLQVSRHDAAAQRVDSQDIWLRHGQPVQLFPTQVHYMWPEELDQLAAGYGFQLAHRYADWDKSPFMPDAGKHISIYRRGG